MTLKIKGEPKKLNSAGAEGNRNLYKNGEGADCVVSSKQITAYYSKGNSPPISPGGIYSTELPWNRKTKTTSIIRGHAKSKNSHESRKILDFRQAADIDKNAGE